VGAAAAAEVARGGARAPPREMSAEALDKRIARRTGWGCVQLEFRLPVA
jgi:hypothetical protein